MRPAGVKLTYDDFLLFPDDGMRHEKRALYERMVHSPGGAFARDE